MDKVKIKFYNVQGVQEASNDYVYGAAFREVKTYTPYYQTVIKKCVNVPWLAKNEEIQFMNRYKAANELPVVTYKELELSSIPYANYENVPRSYYFDPNILSIKGVEGFSESNHFYILKLLLAILLIILICNLMKQ